MSIGWALLGTGRHADRNVIPQMRKAADTRLVAVVSRDAARGEAFAREHGIAKVHASLAEALADPDIHALYDATPDGLHAPNAIAAAKAGKHVLVEKPLAISQREGLAAIRACRDAGVKLGVVFNQRHEAVHREARRMVLAGELGEVLLARVQVILRPAPGPAGQATPAAGGNWRAERSMRAGGILMSIGDHAFDTLTCLAGQEIVEVAAFTDAPDPAIRDERVAGMLLRLSRGAIGYAVSSARTAFATRPFEIHGTQGSIAIGNSFAYLSGAAADPRTSLEIVSQRGRFVRHFEPSECFRLEVERFNRAIEGKEQPMTRAEEALRSLAVTDALYASVRDGRSVRVPEIPLEQP